MKLFKVSFLLFVLLFNVSLYAQQFLTKPIIGAGRNVLNTRLIGVIGNKEIRSNVTNAVTKYNYNLLIYENEKQTLKEDIQILYNNEKYVPDGYFIMEDRLIGYFIAGTKESEDVKLCLQEFDTDLNFIGKPIEVTDLPKGVDPTKLLSNKSGGLFKDKLVERQHLTAEYNPKNKTVLFCFSIQLTEQYNFSSAKIILLDEKFSILSSVVYPAVSTTNFLQINSQTFFDNNDVVVSISEGRRISNSNGYFFEISKQELIYIPANGTEYKELEIVPDQKNVLTTVVSENQEHDIVVYGIQSYIFDEKTKSDDAYIGIYKYNTKSRKVNRETFGYKIRELLPDFRGVRTTYYELKKIYHLKDGSLIIWLKGKGADRDFGSIVFKIDKNNELVWKSVMKRETVSPMYLVGAIDYFDESGNLNLLTNYHPEMFKNNTIISKEIGKLTFNSLLIKATIDIETGEVQYSDLKYNGKPLNAVLFDDSVYLRENGKYLVRMIVDGKPQFVEVDFTAN